MKFCVHCQNSSRSRSEFCSDLDPGWYVTLRTMVTSTRGDPPNISNSLRKYLHKHPEIIFRINKYSAKTSGSKGGMTQDNSSISGFVSVSEWMSTPFVPILTIELIHDISDGFCLLWYSEYTHTKYCNIFCVLRIIWSPYVFTIKNQLRKHCEKTWRKSDIDWRMKYSMTSYQRQSKANHWVSSLMFVVWMQKLFVKKTSFEGDFKRQRVSNKNWNGSHLFLKWMFESSDGKCLTSSTDKDPPLDDEYWIL